jgi:hypothetical protein
VPFTTDCQEHLVEMPFVPELCATTFERSGVLVAKLRTPTPHGLVAQLDTTLEQQCLDLTKRHFEAVVKPQTVTDDLSRETVAFVQAVLHEPLP